MPIEDHYFTVEQFFRHQTKVKGSVFIGSLFPAQTQYQAEEKIERMRKEFYDATHNCFAYRIDSNTFRYSDDGEPAGTAGKPILSMIDKYKLQRVVLVVTRYFGGTKLGTGGLIRAYSECAEQTIVKARIVEKTNYRRLTVGYPFEATRQIYQLVKKKGIQIQEDATPEGMRAVLQIPASQIAEIKSQLIHLTSGKIKFLE